MTVPCRALPSLALAALLSGPSPPAQAAVPSVDEPMWYLERPEVSVELTYDNEDEDRITPFTRESKQTDTWRQRLEVTTRGWLYHPNLVTFSAGARPEWKRQNTKAVGGFDRTDKTAFFGYFVDASVLKQKPYRLKLYSRRDRSEFDSTLSPDSITDSAVDRATLNLKLPQFPTTLSYEKNRRDLENFFTSRDAAEIVRLSTDHNTDRSRTSLQLEQVREQRQIESTRFNVDQVLANLRSNIAFSEQVRLSVGLAARDSRSDQQDSNTAIGNARLQWQHREKLSSSYRLRADRREAGAITTTTTTVGAGVRHQLYENLTTLADLRIDNTNQTGGGNRVVEANLDLRYRRKIPWGRVGASNGYQYRTEDSELTSGTSQVVDEVHSLAAAIPAFLDHVNADATSILVSNGAGTVIYSEGLDYTVLVVGNTTGILREPLGGIADGEAVLVDYAFTPQAPFKTAKKAFRVGATLDLLQALRLYYSFDHAKENLRAGTRPSDLEDDTIQHAGAELRWRWTTTRLDFEDRATVLTPFTRTAFTERVMVRANERISISLFGDWIQTDFTDSAIDFTERGLGTDLRWRLSDWALADLRATRRHTRGSAHRTDSEQLVARIKWQYGDWSGNLRLEAVDEKDRLTGQSLDRKQFLVQVSRVF